MVAVEFGHSFSVDTRGAGHQYSRPVVVGLVGFLFVPNDQAPPTRLPRLRMCKGPYYPENWLLCHMGGYDLEPGIRA